MRIGIIGTGMIGSTTAQLFIQAGHQVMLANSRGPSSIAELLHQLGPAASGGTVEDAASYGHMLLLAVPWRTPEALPSPELLLDKIVIDAMNPYRADGGLFDLGDKTSSEVIQQRLSGACVVKAFNTIYYQHLATQGNTTLPIGERRAIFLAGDDAQAKHAVAELINQIGFCPVDTGTLREGGRTQEPGQPIYNQAMTAAEYHTSYSQQIRA